MSLKRIIPTFSCLFTLAVMAAFWGNISVAYSREDDAIVKQKATCATRYTPFNVLVLDQNPPFSWAKTAEGEGKYTYYGIGISVLEELFKEANIPPDAYRIKHVESREDLEYQTWHRAVDTSIGVQYYPKLDSNVRDKFLHPAYMSNPIVAIFAKGKEKKKLKSSTDLFGLTGIYIESDHLDFLFPRELYITSVSTVREAFEKLIRQEVDYVLMGFYTATMEAKKFKVEDKIVISETVLRRVENFLTLNRERPCGVFDTDFDAKLKEITSDKVKMQNMLYIAYKDYDEQTKNFPALKVEPPKEPEAYEDF